MSQECSWERQNVALQKIWCKGIFGEVWILYTEGKRGEHPDETDKREDLDFLHFFTTESIEKALFEPGWHKQIGLSTFAKPFLVSHSFQDFFIIIPQKFYMYVVVSQVFKKCCHSFSGTKVKHSWCLRSRAHGAQSVNICSNNSDLISKRPSMGKE